eukprot:scaffold219619_cov14-Tisochrysis_lutea.AAC.1
MICYKCHSLLLRASFYDGPECRRPCSTGHSLHCPFTGVTRIALKTARNIRRERRSWSSEGMARTCMGAQPINAASRVRYVPLFEG